MSRRSRVLTRPVAVAAVVLGTVALAATSPLLFTASITSGVVRLTTYTLPKGWFSTGTSTTPDPTRTLLATTYALAATACSQASTGGPLSSATEGTLTPTFNNAQKVNGWYWQDDVDLSASANHWANHVLCDGTTVVEGCQEAIPVTFTMTAYTDLALDDCITYTNDAGQTVCAQDTQTVSLAAVRDADIVDTCDADPACGIGPCVSAYAQGCEALDGEAGRAACMKELTCWCKAQRPASCGPAPECEVPGLTP